LRIYRCFAFLLFLLVLPVVALGYPDPEKLAREMERLEEYLQKAQAAEGPECAPESLAAAQSHLATYNGYMDDDGCPDQIPRRAVLTGDKIEILVPIPFDDDTQRPLADSYAVLAEVARIMKENPGLRFRVQTHLDDHLPPGQADYVTERRADSILSVLVHLGVPDDRLEAEGRGSREPVAANDSSWGRILNQRVEFIRIP